MARYVILSTEGGSKVAFNPDHIVRLRQDPGVTTTSISMVDGKVYTVTLDLEEAVARLQGDPPKEFTKEEIVALAARSERVRGFAGIDQTNGRRVAPTAGNP